MKKRHFILFVTLVGTGLLALLASCDKEFNPRDKYKDVTIVYCLVNPVDTFHYVRIHKAFLGPEDVLVMAQNPDSSLYPVEDLDVRVFEVALGGSSTKLKVDTITILSKDTLGYFYAPKQRMYRFEKIFAKSDEAYRPEGIIKIEVENKKTGKIVYAETSLVNSFSVKSPQKGYPLNLRPDQFSSKFEWSNAKNGRIYDVFYTMRYREGREKDGYNVYTKKSLVWHMGSHSAGKVGDGTTAENFLYNPGAFYAQIVREISSDESLWRSPYKEVEVAIWCGSEDLYYYHNINKPSSGISQERPEYTNLKTKIYSEELGAYQELEYEAFGLFSSRIVQYISLNISEDMVMKHLPATERQFIKRAVYED
ncbi:MAG: hypothetical protein FWF09_05475 [Bacteroidales bacterium]|nr:hypothetical protein [Bacteroidales bacterium]